jgi:pimeloyl-ACP methyl ester carboxylesterase
MSDSPDWFWEAVDIKPASHIIDVQDCDINYRVWGESDKPGLLFVHGHNAHSHWWDFIAPSFLDNYSVAALDLSGMGDSDHRDTYSPDVYAEEIKAVADAVGFGADMIVIAHSFGGFMAVRAANMYPDRMRALILVDSGVRSPEDEKPQEVERWSKPKVYPTSEIARSRFRLQPPQLCENEYIVNYIAHHSVEHIDEGWVWKFDEELSSRIRGGKGSMEEDFRNLGCKIALIYGEQSESFSKSSADYMQSMREDLTVIPIADAQHHLFLDQPLAFIDALKSLLADW